MLGLSLSLSLTGGGGGSTLQSLLGSDALGLWDAEQLDRVVLSGSSVTTWTDAIGGYAATQAVAGAKPTYSGNSFNGRPGITFDGVDDELALASVPFPAAALPCEIWLLVDQSALVADTTQRFLFGYGNVSATRRSVSRTVTGGVNRAQCDAGNGASNSVNLNTSVNLSGRHVIRAIWTGTEQRCDVDGVVGAASAVIPATATSRTKIGASVGSSTLFAQGVFSAIAVTAPLLDGKAAEVLTLLKARGGIA